MRLIHLSDLHLGKRVNDFSMLEDQEYILREIIQIADREKPDAVLIAGDVYDKSVPSAEAMMLLDDFLVALSRRGIQVFIISGNHDSPERVTFGGRLMENSGVHVSPVYDGKVQPTTLCDRFGPVNIYLLPFIKPANVRRFFPEQEIDSYTQAMAAAIEAMKLNPDERNLLVTHQFVTGASRCDSEELSVGGADNVDVSVFEPFDYVALGHIHGPQQVGRETVRYCGTPLKYSFSESKHQKSVTVVDMGEKGTISLRTAALKPLRDMVELKGKYDELSSYGLYNNTNYRQDYVHISLTDEEDIPFAMAKLQIIYKNLMKLDYDNKRTRAGISLDRLEDRQHKSPLELLEEFYEQQNGQPMSQAQRSYAGSLMEKIWEDEK